MDQNPNQDPNQDPNQIPGQIPGQGQDPNQMPNQGQYPNQGPVNPGVPNPFQDQNPSQNPYQYDGAQPSKQAATPIGQDPMVRMLIPVGRSLWAIAAGYLGLCSVVCFPAPLALIIGLIAIRDIRRKPGVHGMGRAIFGVVMGAIFSVVLLIGLISMLYNLGQ